MMTGLRGDFEVQVCIDHVYLSPGITALGANAEAKPERPCRGGVSRPAKVYAASDHVPVLVELEWPTQS